MNWWKHLWPSKVVETSVAIRMNAVVNPASTMTSYERLLWYSGSHRSNFIRALDYRPALVVKNAVTRVLQRQEHWGWHPNRYYLPIFEAIIQDIETQQRQLGN